MIRMRSGITLLGGMDVSNATGAELLPNVFLVDALANLGG